MDLIDQTRVRGLSVFARVPAWWWTCPGGVWPGLPSLDLTLAVWLVLRPAWWGGLLVEPGCDPWLCSPCSGTEGFAGCVTGLGSGLLVSVKTFKPQICLFYIEFCRWLMAGIEGFSKTQLFPGTGSLCWADDVVQGCILTDRWNICFWGVDRLGLLMRCGVRCVAF